MNPCPDIRVPNRRSCLSALYPKPCTMHPSLNSCTLTPASIAMQATREMGPSLQPPPRRSLSRKQSTGKPCCTVTHEVCTLHPSPLILNPDQSTCLNPDQTPQPETRSRYGTAWANALADEGDAGGRLASGQTQPKTENAAPHTITLSTTALFLPPSLSLW